MLVASNEVQQDVMIYSNTSMIFLFLNELGELYDSPN